MEIMAARHSAALSNRLVDRRPDSPRMPPTLTPLRNPVCPWDAEYGWHRAFEARPEATIMVPAACGANGLRFLLRSSYQEESNYPSLTRRPQWSPAASEEEEEPEPQQPPYTYAQPRMPFGKGRPVPTILGIAYDQEPPAAAPAAVVVSPRPSSSLPFVQPPPTPLPQPPPTPLGGTQPTPLSPLGYPQRHRKGDSLAYESRTRRFGDPSRWQTSSMEMSVACNGAAAYM